jgi:glycosyltransferase involved in cell wall biosynthesis
VIQVSVCIPTYNHERYVAQAIEGALMQRTNFPYEILIGEDDSSDNTRSMVIDYAERNPNKIRLFLNDRKNVIYVNGRPTGRWNLLNLLTQARGRYIALCEGDDFWTDGRKLQKQVDYLEAHPENIMCFHTASIFDQKTRVLSGDLLKPPLNRDFYTLDDLLEFGNFIPTASVMFRSGRIQEYPSWFMQIPFGDIALHMMHAQHGTIGYIDETMSVYRRHSSGAWSGTGTVQNLQRTIETLSILGENLDLQQRRAFQAGLRGNYSRYYTYSGMEHCEHKKYAQASYAFLQAIRLAPSEMRRFVVSCALHSFFLPFPIWYKTVRALYHRARSLVKLVHTALSNNSHSCS